MKNKNLTACRKGFRGKLTSTQCVLQSMARSFVPHPLPHSPPPPLESSPKRVHYLKHGNTFSQYCLAMQIFVFLTVLHLHVSANVVAHKCFLFIHLFGVCK